MRPASRLLRKLLEYSGVISAPFFLNENPDYAHIAAGEFSYGKPLIMGWDGSSETRVSIGKFCSIADGVRMQLRVNHPVHSPSTYPLARILGVQDSASYEWSAGPITIGHDVWIGQDALILGGVSIGHGAIVAARAVVTKDVPPYGIAAGNPARIVKSRFEQETVKKLLELQWWDWPIATIKEHASLLSTGTVEQLCAVRENLRSAGAANSIP